MVGECHLDPDGSDCKARSASGEYATLVCSLVVAINYVILKFEDKA